MKKNLYKFGELFSGPGGLALGASKSIIKTENEEFSIQHEWANDIDRDSCDTYIRNIKGANYNNVICDDVNNIKIEQLNPINAFAYGFPCNDFSIVGEQKGFDGKYGPLYTFGVKVLAKFNPIFFVAENVGGIRSANNGNAFKKIYDDLTAAGRGYNIVAHLYKAEHYGIAQTRHRIIMVGINSNINSEFKVPAPTTKGTLLAVSKVLDSIPPDSQNNELTKQSKRVIERLKYIEPGENAWTAKLPEHLKLNVKSAKLSQIYKKLHPEKPAYTITGSGGGGTHGYHYYENRALTNRERAAIQSFPHNFGFCGSKESVRKQIGMAVPPSLSQIIFEAILKTLAGIPYKSIKNNIKHP